MKNVFEHKKASCSICSEPTDERYKRNDIYYCADHYEKESVEEQRENEKNRIELAKHKKFVAGL
jgi:hypothetical protein